MSVTGTVTYRCAECGELIREGAPLLADAEGPLGERALTRDTLAYHEACYAKKKENMTDGR